MDLVLCAENGRQSSLSDHGEEPTAILLQQASAGNERALNLLLSRYGPRLRRWASGRLPLRARDREDTDDLVQEALIRTSAKIGGLRIQSGPGFHAYLRTAILNRIRSHLRHAEIHERVGDRLPSPAEETSPLETAIGHEALDRYERALDQLSSNDRELIVAHVEMDLSLSELAELCERPSANAARVALQRALVRLAKAMDKGSEDAS
ncbi:MAG TPA: sigma-70 family RNA polymerase sigma factor [Candidatus Krumholzibacteria bacterium]|jgi:RNA polymerase sigma-70 factor (ECF subfamily)